MEKDKIFELRIEEDDEISGVDQISLVDEPAIEVNWLAFNKEKPHEFHIPDGEDNKYVQMLIQKAEDEQDIFDQGYVVDAIEFMDNRKMFATNPNSASEWDDPEYLVRYKYMLRPNISQAAIIPTTREFCSNLINKNYVWRVEEMENTRNDEGSSALVWRGGYNCRHIWGKIRYRKDATIVNKASINKGKITEGVFPTDLGGEFDILGYPQPNTVTSKTLANPSPSTIKNLGLAKQMMEIVAPNINIYGYHTRFFQICPGAQATFEHLISMDNDDDTKGMIRSAAQVADNVFRIEYEVLEEENATQHQYEEAIILVDDFKDIISEIDEITDMVHNVDYMDGHIETIEEYLSEDMGYDVSTIGGYKDPGITGRTRSGYAEVGPRGGIRKSDKAPKSDTKNPDPKGEGTAKGKASGKRGAEVTAAQEKTLQKKVDEFNEKDSNTKNGNATLGALKSVFQRGLGAFNTSRSPVVRSAEQWAYARVNAFLYLLKNGRPQNPKYNTDYDLLPNKHPKAMSSEKFIECKKCGHYWNMEAGGNDMYICHKCGYDNKEDFKSYSDYPDSVKNNAKAVLKYVDENGWGSCGTNIGRGRATDLANGSPLSEDTIKRMYSYLSRHKVDLETSKSYKDGCGKLMFDAWGGLSGLGWAESKINAIEKEKMSKQQFQADDEKRIVIGPAMIPDLKIFRKDPDGNPYYVFFSAASIKLIAEKYMRYKYTDNNDEMHNGKAIQDVYVYETWIKEDKEDKSNKYGYGALPIGTWFIAMKVRNDEVWSKIKSGELKGFSVSGYFEEIAKFAKEEMFLQKLANLLKQVD